MTQAKTIKRTAIGGGILGLAVLIAMVLNNLPDVGTSDKEFQSTLENSAANQKQVPEPKSPSTGRIPIDVIKVVISDRDYHVELTDGTEQKMAIPEIISHVKQAKGDDSGFRIRVFKRESARASAADQLDKDLKDAGITPDEIHWKHELLPDKE